MISSVTCLILASASVQSSKERLNAEAVFTKAEKSIVQVESEGGQGTGVTVSDGRFVLTAAHILDKRSEEDAKQPVPGNLPPEQFSTMFDVIPKIRVNGNVRQTFLRAINHSLDLALLEVMGPTLQFSLKVTQADHPAIGSEVAVIGNSLGFLTKSITTGIVSGVRTNGGKQLIQHSAATVSGVSGAPLLNVKGEIVGIHLGRVNEGSGIQFAAGPKNIREFLLPHRKVSSWVTERKEPEKSKAGKLGQAIDNVRIFSAANKKSRLFYTAKQYQYLVVLPGPKGWVKVLMANGVFGYAEEDGIAILPYEVDPKRYGGR